MPYFCGAGSPEAEKEPRNHKVVFSDTLNSRSSSRYIYRTKSIPQKR